MASAVTATTVFSEATAAILCGDCIIERLLSGNGCEGRRLGSSAPRAVEQREDAPRVREWPPWAQTDSPELGECMGRGPTELRLMPGELGPVAGTYRKYIHM